MSDLFRAVRLPVDDQRLAEVARLGPLGWYLDHAVNSLACVCHPIAPADTCDVGQALFRVRAVELVPRAAVRA